MRSAPIQSKLRQKKRWISARMAGCGADRIKPNCNPYNRETEGMRVFRKHANALAVKSQQQQPATRFFWHRDNVFRFVVSHIRRRRFGMDTLSLSISGGRDVCLSIKNISDPKPKYHLCLIRNACKTSQNEISDDHNSAKCTFTLIVNIVLY